MQGLVSLLKKRIQIQKDHLKAMQKLSQSVHDDHQLRQVKFEGLVFILLSLSKNVCVCFSYTWCTLSILAKQEQAYLASDMLALNP